ncbi:hypothetical protein YZ70_00395 [Campylobacter concisus]|uniref:hypothetical protein n=1 Tax=Campylobacter concisus TaxID=199 RepID=UPI001880F8E3|nr:hypothetical protein [Campylobacter concisus]MBE8583991.1 hypothetical protein [Campylobacter concisus]
MANDSIQVPKMPEQNKAKREKFKKPKTWAGFCKFSFSQSPSKKQTVIKLSPQKDIRQARNSKTQ